MGWSRIGGRAFGSCRLLSSLHPCSCFSDLFFIYFTRAVKDKTWIRALGATLNVADTCTRASVLVEEII